MKKSSQLVSAAGLALVSWLAATTATASHVAARYDLPTQPLEESLRSVARKSDINVLFDRDLVSRLQAPALDGQLSAGEAITRLLHGTGLTFEFINDNTVVLPAGGGRLTNGRAAEMRAASLPSGLIRLAALESANPGELYDDGSEHAGAAGDMRLAQSGEQTGGSSQPLAAAAENPDSGKLQEVVVTAQRRAERLQNVPISAVVIGEQARVEQNLNSLGDLLETTSGVHVGQNGSSNNLYIRGIGSGENGSFDQSVGVFIDDIYHGRSRVSAATFLDLDRVEVLKGPQSTFFGNNAIAGALNVVTKKPGDTLDGAVRALYGEYGQYAVEGAAGGPLNDTLSVRGAATFNGLDGWLLNVNTGQHQPEENNMAGRVTLLFRPSDDLDATLKIEGSRNRNNGGQNLQIVNCPPPAPFPAAGFCKTTLALGLPTGLDNNKNANLAGEKITDDTGETALTLNYRKWNHTLTSVTGFYGYAFDYNPNLSGLPLVLLTGDIPEHYHQFSQELRVSSQTGQAIEYLGGIYFQTDQLHLNEHLNFPFLSPLLASGPPFSALVPYLPLGRAIGFDQGEQSYSAFGSLSWNATERLKLSAGLRASRVDKNYDWNFAYGTAKDAYGQAFVPLPASVALLPSLLNLGEPGAFGGDRSDHAWMPSAKIQYQLDAQAMVYFSYSRGFKAGGFNSSDTSGDPAMLPFAPERVNAYEVGVKSKWFDDRVLLNLAAFSGNYKDLQVSVNVVNATSGNSDVLVRNAASSKAQGAEFEGEWAVSRSLRLRADVSYLDSYYGSYPNAAPTQLEQFEHLPSQDLSGRPTAFAPRWSGNLAGIYSVDLPHDYRLITQLSAYFSSSYFLTVQDDPTLEQGHYTRVDGRLALETADGRWGVDFIGKNLTDRDIAVLGVGYPTSLGSSLFMKQQPRSVALQVRYHW